MLLSLFLLNCQYPILLRNSGEVKGKQQAFTAESIQPYAARGILYVDLQAIFQEDIQYFRIKDVSFHHSHDFHSLL